MANNVRLIDKPQPKLVVAALSQIIDWGQTSLHVGDYQKNAKTLGEGVKVAVLDTGVDTEHPDLKPNLKAAVDFTGCGVRDTKCGHGSHVSGIIAAAGANDTGVLGVAPKCELYSARVLDDDGTCPGDYQWIIDGIHWAIAQHCDVINMSLGSPCEPPPLVHSAIQAACAAGIIVVVAAGNDGQPALNWPARYAECVAVAAIGKDGRLANFSDYGTGLAAVAPGVDIYSTWLNGQYCKESGSSMSAPFISGMIALMLSYHRNGQPHATPLVTTADAITHLRMFERGKCVTSIGEDLGIGILDFSGCLDDVTACSIENGTAVGVKVLSRWTLWDSLLHWLSHL